MLERSITLCFKHFFLTLCADCSLCEPEDFPTWYWEFQFSRSLSRTTSIRGLNKGDWYSQSFPVVVSSHFAVNFIRKSNPDITKWMTANNISGDYAKLEQVYIQQVLDISKEIGYSYVVWQEVVDNGVKVRAIESHLQCTLIFNKAFVAWNVPTWKTLFAT